MATGPTPPIIHTALAAASRVDPFPLECEEPDKRTEYDANDDVPVVVHGQQHDPVRQSKVERMQQSAYGLLPNRRSERRHRGEPRGAALLRDQRPVRGLRGAVRAGRGERRSRLRVPLDQVPVVHLGGAAQELEEDDEQDDADAQPREPAARFDLPRLREEAGVGRLPVP